jgi:heme a synthase
MSPVAPRSAAAIAQPVGKFFYAASLSLATLTYFLIALGGAVRKAGAGLACPDWPLCFGQLVPAMDTLIFLEWFHRAIAGSVGILTLAVSGVVLYVRPLRERLGPLLLVAVGLLAVQVVLGGMTVIGLLAPGWVTSHLIVGLAFWGTVLLVALRGHEVLYGSELAPATVSARESSAGRKWLVRLGVAVVFGQAILGGAVSSTHAGLACPDFPTCNGLWLPELRGAVGLQFLHRLGGVLTVAVLIALPVFGLRPPLSRRGRIGLLALPFLGAGQFLVGGGSVLLGLPMGLSLAHLALAAALVGTVLLVSYDVERS